MKRRNFLKNIAATAAAPVLLNGIPMGAMAVNSKMFDGVDNDKVLVMVQLHGGNDGLNMVIPVGNYVKYYEHRANIAIPDSGTRKYIELNPLSKIEDRVGLHPDMTAMKEMYDAYSASVVQSVGYENMNMSHFRSRDILFGGTSYDDMIDSGWMGRYLEDQYPGYPDGYPNDDMEDPLGLELGNVVSLAFQRRNSIPAGISLLNPGSFHDLIASVGVQPPVTESFTDDNYGRELKYLTDFELKTNEYAERLKKVYDAGTNSEEVSYPTVYPFTAPKRYINNPLTEQLKIIARLISGGSKTKFFLVRMGGFDTHAQQVERPIADRSRASMGRHAALLYNMTSAIKAFHDDLDKQGFGDRAMTMTFSEFGRRVQSNGSYGTDHGKASPMLLFGKGLKRTVHGDVPDLDDLDRGNLKMQYDYRQVYSSVLIDWMGANQNVLRDLGFGDFIANRLPLLSDTVSVERFTDFGFNNELSSCWPNPVRSTVKFEYGLASNGRIRLVLYDTVGRVVKELYRGDQGIGTHIIETDLSDLTRGNYIYKLETEKGSFSKVLVKE